MCVPGAEDASESSVEELALAREIAEEVGRHGGSIVANFLFVGRPDLRRRLGDQRLLRFVRRFPELLEVRSLDTGHSIRCRSHGEAARAGADRPSDASVAPGATLDCNPDMTERAVHAIRQLEQDVLRSISGGDGARVSDSACSPCPAPEVGLQARDVFWLLRNGKIRRRISAVVRFCPLPALFHHDPFKGLDAVAEKADDTGEGVMEPKTRHRCPVSGHARTLAAYLLQFFRDRPERYVLAPSARATEFGQPPQCLYNDPGCTCNLQVRLVEQDTEVMSGEEEAFLTLLARRVLEICRSNGSSRIPLTRIGREKDIHDALKGRSLLRLLEKDSRLRALRGLPNRFCWNAAAALLTLSLHAAWIAELDANGVGAPREEAPCRAPRRAPPPQGLRLEILSERPGLVAVRKEPGVTTEATLEGLQRQYEETGRSDVRIMSVSRLDRDTSGVLVAATSPRGAECLIEQFASRTVSKTYLALCVGHLQPSSGEVNARLYSSGFSERNRVYVSPKGKEAVTQYEVLAHLSRPATGRAGAVAVDAAAKRREVAGSALGLQLSPADEMDTALRHYAARRASAAPDGLETDESPAAAETFTLVSCHPLTGRTHQIRAHLAFRGHALAADPGYLSKGQCRSHFAWCPRLFLHCRRMRLLDTEGQAVDISAPLPADLRRVLDDLGVGQDVEL